MIITYLVEHVTDDGPEDGPADIKVTETREFSGRGSRQAAAAYARTVAAKHRREVMPCHTDVTRAVWRHGHLTSHETWGV